VVTIPQAAPSGEPAETPSDPLEPIQQDDPLAALEQLEQGTPIAPLPDEQAPPLPELPDTSGRKRRSNGSSLISAMPMSWRIGGIVAAGVLLLLVVLLVTWLGTGGMNRGQSAQVADSQIEARRRREAQRLLAQIEAAKNPPAPAQSADQPEPEPEQPPTDTSVQAESQPQPSEPAPPEQPAVEPAPLTGPEAVFAERFGRDLDRAARTLSPEDDAQIAGRIIEILDRETFEKADELHLLHRAVELGTKHPAGYAPAATALERLGRLEPDQATEHYLALIALTKQHIAALRPDAPTIDRLLEFHLRLGSAYLAADQPAEALEAFLTANELGRKVENAPFPEIAERIRTARAAIDRKAQVGQLLAALAEDPTDQSLRRQIVDIYLFEQDSPRRAKPYAQALDDEALKQRIALAATDLSRLSAEELLTLARWYEQQGMDEAHVNRTAMLIRAKAYYEQYLAIHEQGGDQAAEVFAANQAVDKQLQRLGVGMKLARRLVKQLRGEDPAADVNPAIEQAIRKGVAWLYANQDPRYHWEENENDNARDFGGRTALAAYALMMAEQSPQENVTLAKAINFAFAHRSRGTYAACFRAHLWEMLPVSTRARSVVRQDTRRVVMHDYARDGTVGYRIDRRPTKSGDLSTTLAGELTLWLAQSNGIEVKKAGWPRICHHLIKTQTPQGQWRYREDREPSPAMTCAGLTILLMAMDLEALSDYPAVEEAARGAIERGLYWLDSSYQPNMFGGQWQNYGLAVLQHVGLMTGRRTFNNQDWYATAAEHLINRQAGDGSWGNNAPETAFGVVFLARGGVYYNYIDSQYEPAPAEPLPQAAAQTR
jgi:ribosomal protein S18 acetylase RimI-like enzyme